MHIYDGSDGNKYPSVTTIIHNILLYPDPLLKWANSIGLGRKKYDDIMLKSSIKGTAVHELLQSYMTGCEVSCSIPIADEMSIRYIMIEAEKYFKKHNMGPATTRSAELTIVSPKLRYAGTLDWLGEMDGSLTLVDYKTSKDIRPYMPIQLAAYDKLLQEEENIVVDQACILLMKDTGVVPKIFTRHELDMYFEIFLHMQAIFEGMHMMEELLKNES